MKNNRIIKCTAAALTAALLLGGCGGINSSATLVNIDGGKDKITLGFGNFVARYTQASYDMYYRGYFGDEYWSQDMGGGDDSDATGGDAEDNTMEASTKKDIMDRMEEYYLCKQHADEYKVEVTDKDEKAIEKAAKEFMENNSDEAIEQMGATQEYAEDMMRYETYGNRVAQAVKDSADIKVTKDEYEQSKVSYVNFSTQPTQDEEGNEIEVTDEDIKAAEKNAKKVAKAKDFDKAVTEAGGTVETGNYTTKGKSDAEGETLPKDVIDAAKKLKKGEVSSVIEVEDDGYYVVRLDSTNDKESSKTKKDEVKQSKIDEFYQDTLKGWKKEIKWDVDEKQWKKVKFDTLFENKPAEKDATAGDAEK